MLRVGRRILIGLPQALTTAGSALSLPSWSATPSLQGRCNSTEALKPLTSTLLVKCPDKKGIAVGLAQILHDYACNITRSDHFTDQQSWMFFHRLCFKVPATACFSSLEATIKEHAKKQGMQYQLQAEGHYKNMAILVSKTSHCLYDLLIRHRQGELKANMKVVISNHRDLEEITKFFGVPFVYIGQPDAPEQERKPRMEAALDTILQEQKIDLIVLARYMQILSDDFCSRHAHQTINIHHSFLPAFVGAKAYHKAFERGVKVIGATAHYATASLDEGPIIEQGVRHISHSDSVKDMVREGKDLERVVLARAVRWHLDNRIIIHENKTVVFV